MVFFIVDLQNEPKWLVQLADFENLNVKYTKLNLEHERAVDYYEPEILKLRT